MAAVTDSLAAEHRALTEACGLVDRSERGKLALTGPEAKAYADHYILVHMNGMAGGKTYSQVSGQFVSMTDAQKASPDGQALAGLRQSLFMGDTLRGLLLYGYAFATMGTIAGIASFISYGAAAALLALVLLGLRHARRVEHVSEVAVPRRVAQPA